eukprot:470977_1
MTSTQSKNPLANQAPPIDLNKLHTPYKLAQFVVNVPQLKHDYSFLFKEENKLNSTSNTQSQSFINKGLNLYPNHSHSLNTNSINLMQTSSMHKMKSKSSSKKKRNKKKSKLNRKLKPQHKYLNKDAQDNINDPYNPINDDVGPPNNIFNSSKKQKQPHQHDLSPLANNINMNINNNAISSMITSPV